ncbi:Uncharacterised protein [Enterobacter cloacae]|nr:Uncharacterised protein [Enterobacter cloacae]
MIAIPNERLRERAREKVMGLELAVTQTAFADSHAELEEELELARIALASLEAEAVAWTDADELRDVKNGGNGYLFAIGGEANKFADPRRQVMLYTTPPAQMLEIENLEHFISFWKKVQAGQMKPGKNDIDHTVWFLEGLSNLTAPPAPVSVPDAYIRDDRGRMILNGKSEPRIGYGAGWNACRAAMLQGAEPVTTAYKLPEGWVAVPVEPTEDMIVNGFESEPDESFSDEKEWEAYDAMSGCQQAAHRAKLCWAAMIAVALKQEVK